MSRARNIKPGFFKNDRLAECEPLARILFAALWCEADREGRLEDRPKRIKAECLPYDDADVDALLGQLAGAGFITRYEAGGARYIAVLNFAKHQNPHVKEAASTIPSPDGTGPERDVSDIAPDENVASTVQAPDEHGSSPADSLLLIPDSLKEPPQPPAGGGLADDEDPKAKSLASITADALAAFNASPLVKPNGGAMPAENPKVGSELRQKNVRRCVKLAREIAAAMQAEFDREWWAGYFEAVHADDFWSGRKGGGKGHGNWTPDFASITRAEVMKKLYDKTASEAA